MNVDQLAESLRRDQSFMENVVRWEELPAREARYGDFPPELDARLLPVLRQRGVTQLYSHQAQSIAATLRGEDVVVVTPTASGKTMCYNLPVLSSILSNPDARALYLFPTKALSADQVSELYELIEAMGVDIKTYTYDGDTPGAARRAVRLYLRRRYPGRRAQGHPGGGPHRGHQSGHAAQRHSPPPYQVGQAL